MKNMIICFAGMMALLLNPMTVLSMDDKTIETTENVSMEISGEVTSIDINNQQILVNYQLEGQDVVTSAFFYFSETMKIYKNGEMVSTSDLKEGDKVTIMYHVDGNGKNVILTLTLDNQ